MMPRPLAQEDIMKHTSQPNRRMYHAVCEGLAKGIRPYDYAKADYYISDHHNRWCDYFACNSGYTQAQRLAFLAGQTNWESAV